MIWLPTLALSMASRQFSLRIPEELYEILERQAQEENRSVTNLIITLLEITSTMGTLRLKEKLNGADTKRGRSRTRKAKRSR